MTFSFTTSREPGIFTSKKSVVYYSPSFLPKIEITNLSCKNADSYIFVYTLASFSL